MVTLAELASRDIISVPRGIKLGHADDICINEENAAVVSLIIYGHSRLFGLLGRGEDRTVPWTDIEKIGCDVILVRTPAEKRPPKKSFFSSLFD